MSVSLRERIAKKLNELSGLREKYGEMTIDVLIIQLEALIGKCGNVSKDWEKEFDKQFVGELRYEAGDAEIGLIDAGEEGIEKIKEFIRKLIATPTFSGGKDTAKHCEICKFNGNCNVQKTYTETCYSFKPTEQKECLHEWGVTKDLPFRFKCALCGEEKPIPAEKKECKHKWDYSSSSYVFSPNSVNKTTWRCRKCGEQRTDEQGEPKQTFTEDDFLPEPKPKDRIEELNTLTEKSGEGRFMRGNMNTIINKLNELIRHINKEE